MSAALGLQTVFEQFMPSYLQSHRLTPAQGQVCGHIRQCRTPALGGVQLACAACGHGQTQYHCCRDRHCPHCQRNASAAWSARQRQSLLPVAYFHVVFTLPHELNGWVECHREVIYGRLFDSVWKTLHRFGEDPKRLGGQLGMTAVLHTWGQTLTRHVHVHCLVPGGALDAQGHWHAAHSNYLFPVKALSRHFRGAMVSALRTAARHGALSRLAPDDVDRQLDALMEQPWVVYSKAWLRRADTVVDYLGRYTHRIALSESRLLAIEGSQVVLRYKAYRDGDRQKTLRLDGAELIRRFLLHVLPKGLMRVRHYGFLANRCREEKLARIRQALTEQSESVTTAAVSKAASAVPASPVPETRPVCPRCGGVWQVIGHVARDTDARRERRA